MVWFRCERQEAMANDHKLFLIRGRSKDATGSHDQPARDNLLAQLADEQKENARRKREAWENRGWLSRFFDRWLWTSTS
jgi:hypothetical protein